MVLVLGTNWFRYSPSLYVGVRELVCCLHLWQKLSPLFVSKFHSVHALSQFLTACFHVTSLWLSLKSGASVAVIICNWICVIALQITDPSSRQKGLRTWKIKKVIVTQINVTPGHPLQEGQDTKMNWPTDRRLLYNLDFDFDFDFDMGCPVIDVSSF
jgi:hypothetical protein